MNCLILGGDKRYYEIIKNFLNKGYNVDIVGYKKGIGKAKNINYEDVNISKYDIIIFPIGGVKDNFIVVGEDCFRVNPEFLKLAKDNCLIFSGINTPCLEQIKITSKKNINFLMNDIGVIKENVIPTVEGIIADIIINTDITINNSNIMVIGYGNVGSYLVKILKEMNAQLIVSIICENDEFLLKKNNIASVYSNDLNKMKKSLSNADVIINTAPSLVLDKEYIDSIQNNCYVLDVASYPHGINKQYLDEKGIKNKIYLGIPSDIAPKTAGKILSKKINSMVGGYFK